MSCEEDLDNCVKAHKVVYIIVKLCVDVEGQEVMYNVVGLFGVWDGCWNASHIVP